MLATFRLARCTLFAVRSFLLDKGTALGISTIYRYTSNENGQSEIPNWISTRDGIVEFRKIWTKGAPRRVPNVV